MQEVKKDLFASGLGQGEEGMQEGVSMHQSSGLRKEWYTQLLPGPPCGRVLQDYSRCC